MICKLYIFFFLDFLVYRVVVKVVAVLKWKRKINESKFIAITSRKSHQYWFNNKAICPRLVSDAVTGVTNSWISQLVDIVGAAVLYLNEYWCVATFSKPANADFCSDCTLGHWRMLSTQPDRELCTTTVLRWTCGHHFCSCSSLEAIPAIECVVTFGVIFVRYVVIFSFCICQILVVLTYVN